jgi:hypothetical protein
LSSSSSTSDADANANTPALVERVVRLAILDDAFSLSSNTHRGATIIIIVAIVIETTTKNRRAALQQPPSRTKDRLFLSLPRLLLVALMVRERDVRVPAYYVSMLSEFFVMMMMGIGRTNV